MMSPFSDSVDWEEAVVPTLSIQGGPKKVSQIIFAITLSTVIQFS